MEFIFPHLLNVLSSEWLRPDDWHIFTILYLFIILGMPCHCKPKYVFKNSLFWMITLSSPKKAGMSVILRTMKLMKIISQMVDNWFFNLQNFILTIFGRSPTDTF